MRFNSVPRIRPTSYDGRKRGGNGFKFANVSNVVEVFGQKKNVQNELFVCDSRHYKTFVVCDQFVVYKRRMYDEEHANSRFGVNVRGRVDARV